MKKLISTIGIFVIGFLTSSCENQAIAQKSQLGFQLSPMNVFPIEPAPDPEDAKRQLPPVNTDPLPDFPPPANPTANIGAQIAAEKALQIAATRYKASNSKVIKSSVMSYTEARQQLSMPLEEDHPLVNTPVMLVELSGTFQRRRQRLGHTVPTSSMTRTKGYIVLRAADGLLLGTVFTK